MRWWVLVWLAACVVGCKLDFDEVGLSGDATPSNPDASQSSGGGFVTAANNGSISLTLGGSISSERRAFVAVTAGMGAGPIACTDSRGNTYTVESQIGAGGAAFVCSTRPASSFAAGDVITATYPVFDGTSTIAMISFETQTRKDASVNSGNDAAPTSNPVSAAARDEILGVVAWTGDAQLQAFGSFTSLDTVDSPQGVTSRHLVIGRHSAATAGQESADATLSAAASWNALVLNFPGDN